MQLHTQLSVHSKNGKDNPGKTMTAQEKDRQVRTGGFQERAKRLEASLAALVQPPPDIPAAACSWLTSPCHFPIHSTLRPQGASPGPRRTSSRARRKRLTASSAPAPRRSAGQRQAPRAPRSHDCWHGGQQARGAEGFPSLASLHNSGPARDNLLPGNPAGTS